MSVARAILRTSANETPTETTFPFTVINSLLQTGLPFIVALYQANVTPKNLVDFIGRSRTITTIDLASHSPPLREKVACLWLLSSDITLFHQFYSRYTENKDIRLFYGNIARYMPADTLMQIEQFVTAAANYL